jgi:hypothetical protein
MQTTDTPPDEFLASLPDGVREDMTALDRDIARVMDGRRRVLWEGRFWGGSDQRIIGYGDFRYTGRSRKSVDWFVVGLAAQKNYITVYVTAVEDGTYLAESHKDRLGKVKVGRSSISFKRLSDVDLPVVLGLIGRANALMPGS